MQLQETQEGGFSAPTNTNAAVDYHPSTTIQPSSTIRASMKRSSPSSVTPSSLHEPPQKKPRIQGFNKLTLPIPFPAASSPSTTTLRRTISEPNKAPFEHSLAAKPQVQEISKNNLPPPSPSPPNASRALLRSISDPTSFAFGSTTTRESPSSQRLEKTKGLIREISHLCSEAIREVEDNEESLEVDNNIENKTDFDSESDGDGDQEAVGIEKEEDCLVVHFNCPCGKGYQILLSGNNCYYNLT